MTTQGPITVYNKRLSADRRDVYIPTRLSAASYSEKMGSLHSDGVTTEAVSYKLRVPGSATATDGRTYVGAQSFAAMSVEQAAAHWTLQRLDLVTRGDPVVAGPADERAIRDAAAAQGLEVIIVEEYADNTGRGSPAVQHWRIGGR